MKIYTFEKVPKTDAYFDDKFIVSRDDYCSFESIHTHDYLEIEYVISGSGVQIINNKAFPVKMGDVIIFNVGDTHSYYSVDELKIINICIEKSMAVELNVSDLTHSDRAVFTLPLDERIQFEYLIYSLEKELKNQQKWHFDVEVNIVKIMFVLFFRTGCFNDPLEDRWGTLIAMVTQKYKSVTLNEAAEFLSVSKNHFCKIFKREFGIPFLEYLNNLRIQNACHLLSHTNKSVESICFEVGFSQAKYFYKVFKDKLGMTPLNYRKKILADENRKKPVSVNLFPPE